MIKHLSNSSLTTYAMCPRRWKFHYVDYVRVPTATNLVFGVAFHETVESWIADEHQGATMAERWEQCWSDTIANQRDVAWGRKSYDSLLRDGLRMFNNPEIIEHVRGIKAAKFPNGKPRIEQYFEVPIPGVGVPLVGYIDVVHEDGTPADFKTSSKPWDAHKAQMQTQPVLYLYALRHFGYDIPLEFKHHVYIKKTATAQTVPTTWSQHNIDFVLELVRNVWKGIKAGSFPAGSNMSWWCSPKFCEYWDHCKRI